LLCVELGFRYSKDFREMVMMQGVADESDLMSWTRFSDLDYNDPDIKYVTQLRRSCVTSCSNGCLGFRTQARAEEDAAGR
jgi:hypothetical protein